MDPKSVRDEADYLHGFVDRRIARAHLLEYLTSDGEEQDAARQELQSLLEMRKNLELFGESPLLRAPGRDKATNGDFTIGTVINGGRELYPWNVDESFFYNHVIQVAAPSHGKTTNIAAVKCDLLEKNVSWVSLDSKSDYSGLAKLYPDVLVVDAHSDLRFNIFEAPTGVEPNVWRNLVSDALAHIGGYGHGSKAYVQKAIDLVVSERGDDFHIGHVYEVINGWSESTRVSADYRDVILSRLELFNECKDVFWCRKSIPFEKIKWLVIRTHKVGIEIHSLIFEILLLREFTYRLINGIKDEQAELKVFFVDEASKTSLSEAREHDWTAREISTPTITKFLTMARQFHLGVWASDQLYSGLSDTSKSVSSTKIIGRLNTGKDVSEIRKDLALSDEEKEIIFKLKVGEWLVRTANISKPFMIRTPDFTIPDITEQEIQAHMSEKRFWIEEEKAVEVIKRSVSSANSQDEWYLLTHVNEHPFTQFSNRLKQGMGKGRLELAKQSLIEKGLVVEEVVKIGAYRPWKLLELTEDGIKMLESVGHDTRFWRHIKNEGLVHCMYKFFISDKLTQIGFDAKREKRIDVENGYRILDVYYEDNDGRKVGVEIECSTSDITNKLRALEQLDMIVLAYMTEESLQRMKEWLAQNSKGLEQKVRMVLLSAYLKELQLLIGRNGSGLKSGDWTKGGSGPDGTKGGRK